MTEKLNIAALIINLFIYIIFLIPIAISYIFFKNKQLTLKKALNILAINTIIETFLNILFYSYSYNILKIFKNIFSNGTLNCTLYYQKILFICSPFIAYKLLIPFFLDKYNNFKEHYYIKKAQISYIFEKILIFISFLLCEFNIIKIRIFLFSIPLFNFIYILVLTIILIKFLNYCKTKAT